jgi:hypothetical protein
MSTMTALLPAYYDSTEYPASPTYSTTADCSEHVVNSQSPTSPTGTEPGVDWIFKSDHMEVNLGPRLWGLRQPSYGLSGTLNGSIKFKGSSTHVELVTATVGIFHALLSALLDHTHVHAPRKLEGNILNMFTERGVVVQQKNSSSQNKSFKWLDKHTFCFPFPAEINICGSTSELPPSYSAFLPGASSEVTYVLKVDMVRKGLRMHERKVHFDNQRDPKTYQ